MGESGQKWSKSADQYLKYSGMAFQMMGVTALFACGGLFLDRRLGWRVPVFTIVLTIAGVVLALYSSFREFINEGKNKKKNV